jgi:hypothetical protein
MECVESNFGWIYYGRNRHMTAKSHFILSGNTRTLCRCHTFSIDEMRQIRFTSINNLFKNQLCRKCLELLRAQTMHTC